MKTALVFISPLWSAIARRKDLGGRAGEEEKMWLKIEGRDFLYAIRTEDGAVVIDDPGEDPGEKWETIRPIAESILALGGTKTFSIMSAIEELLDDEEHDEESCYECYVRGIRTSSVFEIEDVLALAHTARENKVRGVDLLPIFAPNWILGPDLELLWWINRHRDPLPHLYTGGSPGKYYARLEGTNIRVEASDRKTLDEAVIAACAGYVMDRRRLRTIRV